jgi:hypothetical protein
VDDVLGVCHTSKGSSKITRTQRGPWF